MANRLRDTVVVKIWTLLIIVKNHDFVSNLDRCARFLSPTGDGYI